MFVHVDNGTPVVGNLGEVQGLGQIDNVEDVLLKTANTVSSFKGDDVIIDLTFRQSLDQLSAYGDRF